MRKILSNPNSPILGTCCMALPFLGDDTVGQGDSEFAFKCKDIDTNGSESRYAGNCELLKKDKLKNCPE